ncbi:tripartite tricarboxylate transporter TctB family protein [Martelella mangrovi]|uniref:Small-conductance mechanosensitive channel n=1 Tax=Martelella mangrovi TaxID=1397477 RepID=A0ABV2IEZ6_9HYPH
MTAPAPAREPATPLSRGDRIGTLCFLVLVAAIAAGLIVATFSFPDTPLATDVGPARFPDLFATVLIALCAIQFYMTLKAPAAEPVRAAPRAERPNYLRVALGILATIVCIYAMSYVGFAIAAAIYLFVLMRLMGRRQLVWNAIFAILLTAAIYLVFSYGLNVPLPEMIWLDY